MMVKSKVKRKLDDVVDESLVDQEILISDATVLYITSEKLGGLLLVRQTKFEQGLKL